MRLRIIGLIITLAVGLLLAPLPAEAQQAVKVHRVGVLYETSPLPTGRHEGWVNALRELGYIEGQNIAFEFRWAGEKYDLLPPLAAELVRLKVDVIITASTPAAVAAKQVTSTTPIITLSADPVGAGLVTSLGRPGGNITGVFLPFPGLAAKRLQLLKEAVPAISSVAVIWNPANQPAHLALSEVQVAAQTLGITLHSVEVRSPSELDRAFSSIIRQRARGLIVVQDPVIFFATKRIAEFAMKNRLPSSHAYREFPAAGGLMSYGVSLPGLFQAGAVYVDKILKGAKPADLPMEQPTKFEFVVNLKTAKALGLTIPPSVLIRADQVIQ